MSRNLVFAAVFAVPLVAMANPDLEDLIAQKRCTPVKNKTNVFDCMVDQPDGSVKKTRYFHAIEHKKTAPSKKNKEDEAQ